jgi:hypothetical protein
MISTFHFDISRTYKEKDEINEFLLCQTPFLCLLICKKLQNIVQHVEDEEFRLRRKEKQLL